MSTSWAILRLLALAGATWFLLASHASVRADPTLTPEVQAQINRAIDKGVKFLRGTQYRNGTWAEEKGAHKVGYSALPALTLLECGVSPKEPAVQWAAYFVRGNSAKLDSTYELALSILLLDRLGDKRDRPLIEKLSLRLMAGQTVTGGWGYRCPVLDVDQHKSLLGYLKMKKLPSAKVPAYWRNLPVFQNPAEAVLEDPKDTAHAPQGGTTDNSNSQFAMLALWAARRNGVPVERSLKLIVRRFETSQNEDGAWGYHYKYNGGAPGSPAMSCVALLGLAIGHGLANDETEKGKSITLQPADAAGLIAAQAPLLLGWVFERTRQERKDPKILSGFVALDRHIGQPTGKLEDLPKGNLYFLWSVERVAVLYNLKKLGKKDWYLWGAEVLVANQHADGHWQDGGYHGATSTIDTCLALLFLKRANFTTDLSRALPFNPDTLARDILMGIPAEEKKTPSPLREPVKLEQAYRVEEKTPEQPLVLNNPLRETREKTPELDTATEKKSPVLLVILLVLTLGPLLVGGAVFLLPWLFPLWFKRDSKKEEDEESASRPRRKKGKRASSSVED